MQKINLKNRKGQNIVGVLEIPEGEIRGTCVVQHGWGGSKEHSTVLSIKNGFLEKGFQTFNFDTTNSFNESDGDYEKSTLGLHWEDLEDVTKWIQQQDWFVGPLALSGHSKGGYAVARYAEDYPEEVGFVAPVAPVVSGKLSFEKYQKEKPEELEKWRAEGSRTTLRHNGLPKTAHWFQFEERLSHDLLPDAHKITMPILILTGSKDISCPLDHQQTLFNALPEGQKTFSIIEGAPHSYREQADQDACTNYIKDWLSQYGF